MVALVGALRALHLPQQRILSGTLKVRWARTAA